LEVSYDILNNRLGDLGRGDPMRYRLFLHISFFVLSLAISHPAFSRTWYIKQDGTGDAPTIQAGIDSAIAGDTVLVAAGVYDLDWELRMKDGIVLTSESGPARTIITGRWRDLLSGIECQDLGPSTEVSGFWIERFDRIDICSGIYMRNCGEVKISNNIIVDNSVGICIDSYNPYYVYVYLENNTIYRNTYYSLEILGSGSGGVRSATNNIFWGRVYGIGFEMFTHVSCNNLLDISDAGFWADLNFSQPPEFCGPGAGNLFLQSDSPCAPGNAPIEGCDELIGALPVGCGTSPVEHKTWGHIKAMYRE
jgi:parallel beta-helix repeat protein